MGCQEFLNAWARNHSALHPDDFVPPDLLKSHDAELVWCKPTITAQAAKLVLLLKCCLEHSPSAPLAFP